MELKEMIETYTAIILNLYFNQISKFNRKTLSSKKHK